MEAGGIDVGHIFARLDAKLDDRNFKRFDTAVDKSRAKAQGMARDQDKLSRSTQTLSREQQRHAKFLRSQGYEWAAVAKEVGVNEDALKSWNTTSRTTVREQERVRRSVRETGRESRSTSKDISGLEGVMARANRATTFFGRTLRLLKWPALIAGAGAALQGINALAAGTVALTSALAPLSGLLVTIPAGLGTLGQTLGTAALSLMGVGNAVKALNSEEVKSGKVAEDTAKKRRSAAQQIRSAEEQLADSQRSEKGAQRDLNKARLEAVKTLQDMRNAAIQAKFGEQDAQLALRRSIVELRKAEINPKSSFLEIEELELGVREARQGVKEARLDRKRADQEDRKERRGGVKKDPGVVEAKRSLADAQRGVAQSARDVAEAEKDATESLSESSSAASKVEESFAKLTPEAARFSRFLYGLKPQLQGLQATAAKGFLPGAEKGITSTLRNLPAVQKVIGATSRVMGNLSERAGRFFGSRGFGKDLETVGRGNAQTLGLMGRSAEHLFKGLTNVLVVAQPFLRWTGKFVNQLTAWVEKSTEVNKKNGDMARFFGRTRQVVEVLSSIFEHLGGTLHVIGEEAAPLGREILAAFDQGSEGLEKWAKSTEGRKSIGRYFKEAKGPLFEFGRLVRDIIDAFFELGEGQGGVTRDLIHQMRVELLPVITEVLKSTTESFGPHVVEMLTQVLGLFARLSGASGPLTLYVESLTAAAKITNTLLDAVPGLRGLTVNLLGLVAVMKTVTTIGHFTGITKGLELLFGEDMGDRLKGRFRSMMKSVFLRGALALNYVVAWGEGVAQTAAGGISKQLTRFRAVARKAAIAFIGTFAPEVAAGMAAGGRLGELLGTRFPKIAGMFKRGGKLAGKGFIVGVLLGAVLLGVELGNMINKKYPDLGPSIRHWGIRAGEDFVNALIDAVNLGIKGINKALDEGNPLGKLGVDAPNIGEVGHVNWHSSGERKSSEVDEAMGGKKVETYGGRIVSPKQAAKIAREVQEGKRDQFGNPVRGSQRQRDRGGRPAGPEGPVGGKREEMMGSPPHPGSRRKPEDEAKDTGRKVLDEHKKLRRGVEDESTRMQRTVLDRFGRIRKGGSEESKRLDKSVTDSVTDMQGAHDRSTRQMLTATDSRFEGMRDIVTKRSGRMAEDLGDNVDEMNRTTSDGMDHIQRAVVKALKAFGVKDVNLDLKEGGGSKGKPRKAAQGGVFTVPGEGLQDTVYLPGVHAMVAPGEELFAATRHQQPLLDYAVEAALGVQGGLDGFFSTFDRPHYLARGGRAASTLAARATGAIRRFAGGGRVVLDPGTNMGVGQEPQILRALRALSGELGKIVYVISGYRSPQHSVEVGGFANDPHTRGEAADIGVGSPLLETMFGVSEAALKAVGLYRPFYPASAHEVNHVQLLAGGPKGGFAGAGPAGAKPEHVKAPHIGGRDGTFRTLVEAALGRTTEAGNRYIDRKASKRSRSLGGLGISVPSGPIQKMAREMVSQIWGPSEFGAFNALEMSEAGWDPRAENPSSGAAGLAQALPSSKYPPGAWPYRGVKSARLQLEWMMGYIRERYGSPAAAWSFHQANNWYARGGRVMRRFARGGAFKGNINHRYSPHWAPDYSGATLPSYVVAALAEAAGAPGRTMEQVTRGESGAHRKGTARPGAAGVDAGGTRGYGLWAITEPFSDAIVSALGGYGEMFNPVKNAAAMKAVLGQNGIGAWYGTGSVTGSNLHYTGGYDVRNALGGLSFKEALMGRKTPGPESLQGERKHSTPAAGVKGKRRKPPRMGLAASTATEAPSGKYSPQALLRVVAETGIGLPYALLMNGVPNWRGLSSTRYGQLVNSYYRKISEYRQSLGEERQQAEESFKANPTLPSVTALSSATIASAIAYNAPTGSDASAYGTGYGALAALDKRAAATRSTYLNTYSEAYLKPYREKEALAEYIHEGLLKSVNPEAEKKAFELAKLKGLRRRMKRTREGRKPGKKSQSAVAAAQVARSRRGGKRAGRRFARGGRITMLAKGGKSKQTVAQQTHNTAAPSAKATRKKVQAQIRHHNRVVDRRGAKRQQYADDRYEEESEGILDPVEKEREELEAREAYEAARREELAPLLNEIAVNVQRTSLIGAMQSSLFSAPTFARGGRVPPAAASAAAQPVHVGSPSVTVPLAVQLSGAMEALNPQIQAVVDGRLRDLGQAAGSAKTTVSAPGRRVSYGGN